MRVKREVKREEKGRSQKRSQREKSKEKGKEKRSKRKGERKSLEVVKKARHKKHTKLFVQLILKVENLPDDGDFTFERNPHCIRLIWKNTIESCMADAIFIR